MNLIPPLAPVDANRPLKSFDYPLIIRQQSLLLTMV